MYLKEAGFPEYVIEAMSKKKIYTLEQLARWVPRKYHDYSTVRLLQHCTPGKCCAVKGRILSVERQKAVNRRFFLKMRMEQADGIRFRCQSFSRAFQDKTYWELIGRDAIVCGMISFDETYGYCVMEPDVICKAGDFVPGIMAVYPKIGGILGPRYTKTGKLSKAKLTAAELEKEKEMLAEYIDQAVSCQAEYLPARIYAKAGQIPYGEALDMVHRPSSGTDFCKGRDRLLFDEMLFFYLSLKASNDKGSEDSSLLFEKTDLMQSFIESLPFLLTAGQKAVTDRIAQTGMSGKRCNFLIQGDVGCGKTVVAIAAMFAAYENGMQSVLMAPRAVLARQHYEEVKKYADQFGITCVFLDSKMKSKEKWKVYEMISSGEAGFIVGTHSCVSEAVEYNRLGLVVTDEEHLFGVNQKEALQERAQAGVHSISMSATPIPRSLASVLYGEKKEICIIKDKPAGRKPVITRAGSGRENVFPFIEKQIRAGRQCYVVCPAIEESDDQENPRAIVSIKAVASEYKEYFEPKGIGIGFVDGKKKPEEIKKTMKEFAEDRLQILISTTVIEVGVNVPNATVMVVEQADVFGLASLHQLRGRVGRSSLQSYCFLLSEEPDNERLQTMCSTNDGFEIAEADLRQRGTGNLIGTEQAGMNRFVTTMLDNPLLYQSVKKFADENITDIQAAAILLSSPLRDEGADSG